MREDAYKKEIKNSKERIFGTSVILKSILKGRAKKIETGEDVDEAI